MTLRETIRPLVFILALATSANVAAQQKPAASPSAQFQREVAQLQANPSDDALRTQIIQLALSLYPKPAVPNEAAVTAAKAKAIFTNATTPEDMKAAAGAFAEASVAAPWVPEYYFNQGVALEKAGHFEDAIRALTFYLAAHPNDPEVKGRVEAIRYEEQKRDSACKDVKYQQDIAVSERSSLPPRKETVQLTGINVEHDKYHGNDYTTLTFKDIGTRPTQKYVEYRGWNVFCADLKECGGGRLVVNEFYDANIGPHDEFTSITRNGEKVDLRYLNFTDRNIFGVIWFSREALEILKSCH